MARLYLDWNASAPLRREAREAMLRAMDATGNPSSVHAEGRRARGIVEHARTQIAAAVGAEAADIVFTSGATEGAALACAGQGLSCAPVEHPAVAAWCEPTLVVSSAGAVTVTDPGQTALQLANSETGILQDPPAGLAVTDLTQAFGKVPVAFDWLGATAGLISAHKIGGPRGAGALILKRGVDIAPRLRGGGQELGRRAGTENVVGIAGFGAAAEAAARDLSAGMWDEVAQIRDILESALSSGSRHTILLGKEARRLPNTTCVIAPGWRGETQVMAMDLAGFAISAGSACSSGKVRASKVLAAMGLDDDRARQSVRISIGPGVTEEEVLRFAQCWNEAHARVLARAIPAQ